MFTKTFSTLGKTDAEIAGGKGASLGEMLNAGIPVPDGYVVLSTTFDAFLKEADLIQEVDAILEKVDHKTISSVESASEKIQGLIKNAVMPESIASEILSEFKTLDTEFVAVRSSATAEDGADHAWAGQLESYLNTTEKDILEKVQHCWASLFTPRAIFYRFEKGLHDTHISVAVVVQKMVNSEKSGIAFSVHPVTEDRNQLIIEAGLGLGEAIVSGSVTPDSYVVEKEPRNIIDININHQNRALYRKPEGGNEWKDLGDTGKEQVLNQEEILGLSEIILTIENHYGFPCDIEWAYENNKFYIVQSRPITTLSPQTEVSVVNELVSGIDTNGYQHFGMWKCNPFAEYFWVSWFNKDYLKKLGIDLSESGVLVLNGGHFFVKKTVVKQAAHFIESKINTKEIDFFDSFVNFANDLYQKSLDRSRQSLNIKNESDFITEVAEIGKDIMFPWFLGWLFCEVYESHLQNIADKNGISSEKISEYIPLISTPLMEQQGELRSLKQTLIKKGIWEDLKIDPRKVIDSIKQDNDLSETFDDHLKKYAWIQILNFLGEDITIENLLDQMTHLNDQEKQHEKPVVPSSFEYYAIVSSRLSYLRQTGAEYFSIYTQIVLPRIKEIASSLKLSHRELLEFLPSEIDELLGQEINSDEILTKRKNDNWCVFADINSNLQIVDDKEQIDVLIQKMTPKFDENQDLIKGQVGNKGFATGKVKVILANTEFDKMEVGDVLVTTMTTPDFVILMQKASAIITDIGGLLCHAAIVSREINKPCVIGTKNATQILKDGDMVEVDANKGTVTKLS